MSVLEKEIFKKLAQSEKKELLRGLLEKKVEFVSKGEGDDIIYFMLAPPLDRTYYRVLMTRNSQLSNAETVIVNFTFDQGRYFFQSLLEKTEDGYRIDMTVDIFYLQRRSTPRLLIPKSYFSQAVISKVQGRAVFLEGQILDFSSGGCRISTLAAMPRIEEGYELQAHLHLGAHRRPLDLQMIVRHLAAVPPHQTFGCQFIVPTTLLENRLLVLYMDLQRDIYFKTKPDQQGS